MERGADSERLGPSPHYQALTGQKQSVRGAVKMLPKGP